MDLWLIVCLLLESFNSRKFVKEACTINVEFLYVVLILG